MGVPVGPSEVVAVAPVVATEVVALGGPFDGRAAFRPPPSRPSRPVWETVGRVVVGGPTRPLFQ